MATRETRVKDRRKHPCVQAGIGAKVSGSGIELEAEVHDVSMSGVLLLVDRKIEEMTMVQMRLLLPTRSGDSTPACSFELTGAVVRCAPLNKKRVSGSARKYEVAVFFTGMPLEARAALQGFINDRID